MHTTRANPMVDDLVDSFVFRVRAIRKFRVL